MAIPLSPPAMWSIGDMVMCQCLLTRRKVVGLITDVLTEKYDKNRYMYQMLIDNELRYTSFRGSSIKILYRINETSLDLWEDKNEER